MSRVLRLLAADGSRGEFSVESGTVRVQIEAEEEEKEEEAEAKEGEDAEENEETEEEAENEDVEKVTSMEDDVAWDAFGEPLVIDTKGTMCFEALTFMRRGPNCKLLAYVTTEPPSEEQLEAFKSSVVETTWVDVADAVPSVPRDENVPSFFIAVTGGVVEPGDDPPETTVALVPSGSVLLSDLPYTIPDTCACLPYCHAPLLGSAGLYCGVGCDGVQCDGVRSDGV